MSFVAFFENEEENEEMEEVEGVEDAGLDEEGVVPVEATASEPGLVVEETAVDQSTQPSQEDVDVDEVKDVVVEEKDEM